MSRDLDLQLRLIEQEAIASARSFAFRRWDEMHRKQKDVIEATTIFSALMGGNQCLASEQVIYDPVLKIERPVSEIDGPFHVEAWDEINKCVVIVPAEKPFCKNWKHSILELSFSNGTVLRCSAGHKILTPTGWRYAVQLQRGFEVINSNGTSLRVIDSVVLRADVVWDFTVPKFHTYIIGGVVNHNTGKSTSSMLRMFFHSTGEYPIDWGGARTVRGQDIWYAGDRWSTLRDSIQIKLFGRDFKNPGKYVPGDEPPYFDEDRIVKGSVRMASDGAIELIKIKHISGGISTITFKTYGMGVEGMASATIDGVCIDEEPGYDVLQELTMRVGVKDGWVCATFTPLKGRSAYYKFLERLSSVHGVVRTIAQREVKHLSAKFRETYAAAFAHDPSQLLARTEGKPVIDKGLVFPFDSADVWIDYFPIPNTWPRVGGMDIGVGSPTTCMPIAIDPNTGDKFLYGRYSVPGLSARQNHFGILEAFGDLNISIDMAANQRSQDTAKTILDAYNEVVHGKDYRRHLRPEHWKYRPVPNRSFKVGHDLMLQDLHQGKFYVLKDRPWLKKDPLGTSGFRDQFEEAEWDDSGDNIKDKHKFHDIDAWRYGMVGIGFAAPIQLRRMISGYRRPTPTVPDWVPTPGNLR